jgi:hypothetical protein
MSKKSNPAGAKSTQSNHPSRRDFIKAGSAVVAGTAALGSLSIARAAHAYGSDEIKIGLIGCGGRGTGAAVQAMNTKGPTKLVAMHDVFGDRLQSALRSIKGQHPDKFDVPQERQFTGLDGWKKVLETDCPRHAARLPPLAL